MTLTEKPHDGCFLLNEDAGAMSRDSGFVASGQNLASGTVVSLSNGKWSVFDSNTNRQIGVLYTNTDATNADKKTVVITRKAEVDVKQLIWPSGFTSQQIANGRELLHEAGIETR